MEIRCSPQHCRWAQPTLFLPLPYWLESWNRPWTCERDATPRPLDSGEECSNCPRFEPRAKGGENWGIAQVGL